MREIKRVYHQKEHSMYTALYRTCRPEVFEEILGQEHIVKILRNQIATGTLSHAYLFCGTRGTGKTTTARILAKAVNCLDEGERPCGICAHCKAIKDGNFLDVIEIDAASNNGVENIRELRESVKYPPAVGRKKVYIIDEVHMLSTGAFNALLKTLEEPPEHVMFILATTEPHKLPPTILSRCMRLDFRRVSQSVIADDMRRICALRGVDITDDAVRLLANCADGSVRDGLSILDQVLAGGDTNIDREKVLEYVGTIGEDFFIDLTELVSLKKSAEALVLLNGVLQEGKDVKQIMKDWVSHYRSLLITKFVKDAEDMLNMSAENLKRVTEQSMQISVDEIDYAVTKLSKTINDARWSTNPRVLLELAIVAIAAGDGYEEKLVRKISIPQIETVYAQPVTQQQVPLQQMQPTDVQSASNMKMQPNQGIQQQPPVQGLEAGASNVQQPAQPMQAMNTAQGVPVQSSAANDELWSSIFEDGEGSTGSYNLLRSGTRLVHLTNDTFTIIANSSFTQRFAEQKKQELEGFMQARLGRHVRMICRLEDEHLAARQAPDETVQIAKEAEALLGIKIDIE